MRVYGTWAPLRRVLWWAAAVFLNAGAVLGMQVISTGPQTIQKAMGDVVTLGCTYKSEASDTGELDIEWSILSPDMTQKDNLILAFTGGKKFEYGPSDLIRRMNFSAADPSTEDASITITGLKTSDTATYQCKVKKAPGIDTRKVTLVVLAPPTVPRCWVHGSKEIGTSVTLFCNSSGGSSPLIYQWTRENGGALPSTATQNFGTGELLIRNHSESFTGTYLCHAKNAVGQEQCRYNLHAFQSTNKTAVIVGSVIAALLLLLLLLLLIWLLVCFCNKRRYEKEVANEIREDAAAPESRPSSRNSSFRSIMGYRAHPGVAYHSVRREPSHTHSERSMRTDLSQGQNMALPGSQGAPYDSKYGYPV